MRRPAELDNLALFGLQAGRHPWDVRDDALWNGQKPVAVAVYDVTRLDCQPANRDRLAKIHDVDERMGHRGATCEELKPHAFDLRQVAHGAVRRVGNASERLQDGRVQFTDKRARTR